MTSEILYRKVGRKYVPAHNVQSAYDKDFMKVGTWRMVYAYGDGGRRYEYDVTPDTASFTAACMLARHAMEKAIQEASYGKAQAIRPFTAKQQKVMKQCEQMMRDVGLLSPMWWTSSSGYDISQAAIEAVKNWREA